MRLAVSEESGRFHAELFTEDLGDTAGDTTELDLDAWMPLLRSGAAELPHDAAQTLGTILYRALLGGSENGPRWTDVLAHARAARRPVVMLIDAVDGAALDLPYGLLYSPVHGRHIFRPSGDPDSNVRAVRIVRRCAPRPLELETSARPPLLLIASEPDGHARFGAAAEVSRLVAELAERFEVHGVVAGQARPIAEGDVAAACRVTRADLRDALASARCPIVHIVGHGATDVLHLQDGDVPGAELAEWFRTGGAELAFVQCCRGGAAGQGAFAGIAQRLLNPFGGNLACVVASAFPLDPSASTAAAIAFYRALARGVDLEAALPRDLDAYDLCWALLDLWIRPRILQSSTARGAFQFVSPYLGLASFEERDADIFCGRDDEVQAIVSDLATERCYAITGEPGAGKSSVMRAGVAPLVRARGLAGRTDWRIAVVRPGSTPVRELGKALDVTWREGAPDEHDSWIAQIAAGSPVLLLIDQAEELFTLAAPDEATRFGTLVRALVDATPSRAIFAVRFEYVTRLAGLGALEGTLQRPLVLRAPREDGIRDIIRQPAARHGYEFEQREGRSLADQLLDDALGEAGGAKPLPLIEFALEQLWVCAVKGRRSTFRFEDYERMGGIAGAIAQHAEDVYRTLPARFGGDERRIQRIARDLLMHLVGRSGTRTPRPQTELLASDSDHELCQRVLDALVGERIVTVRSPVDRPDQYVVDLIHEVLIARWPRLARWAQQDPVSLALRQAFDEDFDRWSQGTEQLRARHPDLVPRFRQARVYLAWARDPEGSPQLSKAQADFVTELSRSVQRTIRRWSLGFAAAVALLAVIGYMYTAGRAEKARAATEREQIAQLQLATAVEHTDPLASACALLAIHNPPLTLGAAPVAREVLDGPMPIAQLPPQRHEVTAIAYAPRGDRVAIGWKHGLTAIYRTDGGATPDVVDMSLAGDVLVPNELAFVDDETLLMRTDDGRVMLYDLRNGGSQQLDGGGVIAMRVRDHDVWTLGQGGSIQQHSIHGTNVDTTLRAKNGPGIVAAQFTDDATRLGVVRDSGDGFFAEIWTNGGDVIARSAPLTSVEYREPASAAARQPIDVDPAGDKIALFESDGTLRVLSIKDDALVEQDSADVVTASFDRNGKLFAESDVSDVVEIGAASAAPGVWTDLTAAHHVYFAPDRDSYLVRSAVGRMQLCTFDGSGCTGDFSDSPASDSAVAVRADRRQVVIGRSDGSVRVWAFGPNTGDDDLTAVAITEDGSSVIRLRNGTLVRYDNWQGPPVAMPTCRATPWPSGAQMWSHEGVLWASVGDQWVSTIDGKVCGLIDVPAPPVKVRIDEGRKHIAVLASFAPWVGRISSGTMHLDPVHVPAHADDIEIAPDGTALLVRTTTNGQPRDHLYRCGLDARDPCIELLAAQQIALAPGGIGALFVQPGGNVGWFDVHSGSNRALADIYYWTGGKLIASATGWAAIDAAGAITVWSPLGAKEDLTLGADLVSISDDGTVVTYDDDRQTTLVAPSWDRSHTYALATGARPTHVIVDPARRRIATLASHAAQRWDLDFDALQGQLRAKVSDAQCRAIHTNDH